MKANELRIGNLITLKSLPNEYQRVLSVNNTEWIDGVKRLWIETDLCEGELFDEFTAIPLTEEWLLKFGFERHNYQMSLNDSGMNYDYELKGGNGRYVIFFNGRWFSMNERVLTIHHSHNRYVHQLQNLYFAITGEELKY